MPKIQASTIDPINNFNLNGLDYKKGIWEIFYNNKVSVSQGEIATDSVSIGLRNENHRGDVLMHPKPITSWVDGSNVPYSDFETLVTDLTSLVVKGDGSASTPAGATEGTLQQVLSAIGGLNDNLTNNTNTLLNSINDSNVAQEALVASTNSLLADIRLDLANLNSTGQISNGQLLDINTELDTITLTLSDIESNDSTFYSDLLTVQGDIEVLITNSNGLLSDNGLKLDTLVSQTDQVETLLSTVVTALANNSTVNAASLEQLRLLLVSIDANTDDIESQLTLVLAEHDQTQVALGEISSKLTTIESKITPVNENQSIVTGTNIDIPAGFKTVLINSLGGVNTLDFGGGNTFQLGTGRRADGITLEGNNLNTKNGLLPAITISGGTWQWIVLSTLTL